MGIGKCTAIKFAKEDYDLALISRRSELLAKFKNSLNKYRTKILIYCCDVSDSVAVQKTFEKIKRDFTKVDYLINNAGLIHSAPIEKSTEADFDEEIAVNLKGTYLCSMAAYPFIRPGGAIVNISSYRGRMGTPNTSVGYAAAKAGVINLTKSFAYQLAKYGIRVNSVSPGAVYPTGLSQNWSEEKIKKLTESTPLGKIAKPEDVSNAIYFLASHLSEAITGQTIDVNGGYWMN